MKNIIKQIKKQGFVLPLFILIYFIAIILINYDKNNRIDEVLQEKLRYLETTYNQGLDRFSIIADTVYMSFQNDEKFVSILSRAKNESIEKVHNEMYTHLRDEFRKIKQLEVLGIQIVTPQNISILRMHDPDKYGDNLSSVRYSLTYVNEHKTHIKGFEEGKASHSFRMIYPIFNRGEYIGALEVDFSSTMLQTYSMRASGIHTHFIVNRNVFKTNEWKSQALEPYEQSIEHKDFMFSISDHIDHPRLNQSRVTLMEPLKEKINNGVATQEEFVVYKKVENTLRVIAFLPVQRIKDKMTVAYLVSYTDSNKILTILNQFKIIILVLSFGLIGIYVLIYKLLIQKYKMENELQYDALTNVYNRKYFINFLYKEYESAKILESDICVVMADIDFFKKVNDTYGHQSGDVVLQEFSSILKNSIREMDKVARYGGEEFIILLLTNEENAYKIVDNMRRKVEEFNFCDEKKLKITASFGISQLKFDDLALESMIQRADEALYKAKENGRNQVKIL